MAVYCTNLHVLWKSRKEERVFWELVQNKKSFSSLSSLLYLFPGSPRVAQLPVGRRDISVCFQPFSQKDVDLQSCYPSLLTKISNNTNHFVFVLPRLCVVVLGQCSPFQLPRDLLTSCRRCTSKPKVYFQTFKTSAKKVITVGCVTSCNDHVL